LTLWHLLKKAPGDTATAPIIQVAILVGVMKNRCQFFIEESKVSGNLQNPYKPLSAKPYQGRVLSLFLLHQRRNERSDVH